MVRDMVFYAESKQWTATSALIFNAVQMKNRPQAQRRAVAAKGDVLGEAFYLRLVLEVGL